MTRYMFGVFAAAWRLRKVEPQVNGAHIYGFTNWNVRVERFFLLEKISLKMYMCHSRMCVRACVCVCASE